MKPLVRFYREARRRKVFRTAALYVVGSWLALQVADVVFPGFGIPEAAIQALVWAAVLGFPVALVFGWLYEIGPGGIRRTAPAGAGTLDEPQPLARRDYLILAAFVAIVFVLGYRAAQDVRATSRDAIPAGAAAQAGDVQRIVNSIAVLPFANISNDPDNEYFCDGVSEEILNALSAVRNLNVIGRTSSFAFKGSGYGVDRISALLGVRYVLQGSVRKVGSQLRISAQLLDQKGVQVWAESFDRQLDNVFEIQSEIAGAVATTVAIHVAPASDTSHQPKIEAYERYLAGRSLIHRREWLPGMRELELAVEMDPDFAEAHAELGIARLTGLLSPEYLEGARQSIDRALALKPRLLRAQAAHGLWMLQQSPPDAAGAEGVLREVLDQDPNMSDALLWLNDALDQQGRADEARAALERAALIDPFHTDVVAGVARLLIEDGEMDRAREILERQLEQPEPGFLDYMRLRDFYQTTGELTALNDVAKSFALDPENQQYYSLALSYALIGDWSTADAWLQRSRSEFPDWPWAPFQVALVPGWQGRFGDAARLFRQVLDEDQRSVESLIIHQAVYFGVALARAGEYEDAIGILAPIVADAPGAGGYGDERNAPHALAWSYLHTGARDEAVRILAPRARDCAEHEAAGRLRTGRGWYLCAETELLLGNPEKALARVERAISAGWRDYYLRERDAYWEPLRDHPRYRALMAKVKADVDRQGAEIRAIDARQNFPVKLDAAIAARARHAPQT